MNEDKLQQRGETLPLKIVSTATPNEILEAAVSKHSIFNKRFDAKMKYCLLFRDGSEVRSIPGTSPKEPFTLKRYKEESGFGYSRITLYLHPIGDVIKMLQEVIESDTSTSSEDECRVSVHKLPLVKPVINSNEKRSGESSVVASGNSDNERASEIALLVNCPTCSVKFPITQIEEHADVCADFRMDFPDPNAIEASQLELPGITTEERDVKEEILALRKGLKLETIRVTVRRKNLWLDYVSSRNSHYSPGHTIKITFCGEPAIDDGGPKREFFSEMLEYCKSRLFPNGIPTNSVLALAREDYRIAGEIMAMSIIQGGPGPNLLAPDVYNFISRTFKIANCRNDFFRDTCKKLHEADNSQICQILMDEKVLDILHVIGYNGVPSREDNVSVKNIIESICIYDQTPEGSMPSILQVTEGLKTYDLLSSIRKNPELWRPIFTQGSMPDLTPTAFLDEIIVNYSESQIKKEKEIDVFFHFSNHVNSLDLEGLQALLKWTVGVPSIPPLGLPKKISVRFLEGCVPGCRCRPTTSTCDLILTIPLHLNTYQEMRNIMMSAVQESEGFGLI